MVLGVGLRTASLANANPRFGNAYIIKGRDALDAQELLESAARLQHCTGQGKRVFLQDFYRHEWNGIGASTNDGNDTQYLVLTGEHDAAEAERVQRELYKKNNLSEAQEWDAFTKGNYEAPIQTFSDTDIFNLSRDQVEQMVK